MGIVWAGMMIALIGGTAAGAVIALILDTFMDNGYLLAIISGFGAVVVANISRHAVVRAMEEGRRKEINSMALPALVWLGAFLASAVASVAGYVLSQEATESAVLTGALAGLFSAMFVTILLITYLIAVQKAQGAR